MNRRLSSYEARIYPLAVFPGDPDTTFNAAFFDEAPNALADLLPEQAAQFGQWVKVIDVPAASAGRYLEIVMDGERGEALAYLAKP